ncbi:hypothetical protein [Flavobacterium sp. UBA4197]|uniref:hypothetical protein n=1 Tax=Flavobacterium sp. UBA4197 TaxID=1946546 RepID=UPI00257A22BA|nr:hypothetical protein [Flavobacterium sp. UBA4197]
MLTLQKIADKKTLFKLYGDQMQDREIRSEINEILTSCRPNVPPGAVLFVRKLRLKEVVIFLYKNDVPNGYVLSEPLQLKVSEYKEQIEKEKALQHQIKKLKL